MTSPVFNGQIAPEAIGELKAAAASAGLPVHNGKQVVAQVENAGHLWQMLEDGSEIMRAPDGQFIEEWPL